MQEEGRNGSAGTASGANPGEADGTLKASPTAVDSGGTVTLTWSSTNATDLDLEPGIGKVAPQGSTSTNRDPIHDVYDYGQRTGRHGHGDSQRVGFSASPCTRAGAAAGFQRAIRSKRERRIFRFQQVGHSRRRARCVDERRGVSEVLFQIRVTIEGHCDERGSTEYNLGLASGARKPQRII